MGLVHSSILAAGSSPSPTSSDPASTAANVALSNYYLAILLFIGAILVIVIALGFAWFYHREVLKVIRMALKPSSSTVGASNHRLATENQDALETKGLPTEPGIAGPDKGEKAAELAFHLRHVDAAASVTWTAVGGTPSGDSGHTFATTFAEDGEYEVQATYTLAGNTPPPLTKRVTIGAARPQPEPEPAQPSSIVIPFVVRNWGRLVIVIFGVGVISALMATKVLDSAAGVGILGTLLGAGAASANTGDGGSTPAPTQSGNTTTTPQGGNSS